MVLVSMAKVTPAKIILVSVALIFLSVDRSAVAAGRKSLTELEIRKELRRLNKPAVKTIKSEDGDIIDCVDIYKQPAFDHPLLKNHTIQMKPSFHESGKMSSSKPLKQPWHKSGSCPDGTIPIRRIRKSDLLRTMSWNESKKTLPSQIEYAKLTQLGGNTGGEALINIWNPLVERFEHSTASLYVRMQDHSEIMNAGWMVSSYRFGDSKTRIYTFWTADGVTGCYNLECPGFIQTSTSLVIGSPMSPVSIYDGEQYFIQVKLLLSKVDKYWWLEIQGQQIGYWPSPLFNYMTEGADMIEWSGEVLNTAEGDKHTTTEMGSGHLPSEGENKAAFFDKIVYFNKDDDRSSVPENDAMHVSQPGCYDVSQPTEGSDDTGLFFYFGGPGGQTCDVQ